MTDILHAPTKKDLPTAEYVRSVLAYDPETGVLRWLKRGKGRRTAFPAGCINANGYRYITINYRHLISHRLAWLITHGEWPTEQIDHINGDRSDNRLCNLRECSLVGNMQNLRKAKTTNVTTGLLGASLLKTTGAFRATIGIEGKQIHLGCFKTAEEAHAVYLEAKRRLHSTCTL